MAAFKGVQRRMDQEAVLNRDTVPRMCGLCVVRATEKNACAESMETHTNKEMSVGLRSTTHAKPREACNADTESAREREAHGGRRQWGRGNRRKRSVEEEEQKGKQSASTSPYMYTPV